MNEFERLCNCTELIVYGAGSVAKHILPYLTYCNSVNVLAVAVSYPIEQPQTLNGYPIVPLDKLAKKANEAVVLVATSACYHEEMANYAQKLGFSSIIVLTEVLKDAFMEHACGLFLSDIGVNVEGKTLDVFGVNILNPGFISIKNSDNILSQAAELLVPPLKNDNRMIVEGPYEYGQVKLNNGDYIFDCGSNMGVFTAYAAYKGCKIYAFEPNTELCPIIEKHAELNNGTAMILKCALSNYDGETLFHEDTYNNGGSSIVIPKYGESKVVPCRTIDSVVDELNLPRVDYIKADIEGAERLMLLGAQKTLKRFAPKLALCTYHLPDDPCVLEDIIKQTNPNYTVLHKWQKLYAWVD